MPPFGCNCCEVCDDGFGSTRKYDADGTLLWSRDHGLLWTADGSGAAVFDVAVDPTTGNVYTVGQRTVDGFTTRAYDKNGCDLWSADHGQESIITPGTQSQNPAVKVEVDSSGNVITFGEGETEQIKLRKYDEFGNQLWSSIAPATNLGSGEVFGLALFSDTLIYVLRRTGVRQGVCHTIRSTDGGNIGPSFNRSTQNIGGVADVTGLDFGIDIDDTGDVHTGGEVVSVNPTVPSSTMQKFRPDAPGDTIWRAEERGPIIRGIRVMASRIWTTHQTNWRIAEWSRGGAFENNTVARVVAGGGLTWGLDTHAGFIYVIESKKIHKHAELGLAESWNVDHGGDIHGVAAGNDGAIDYVVIGGARVGAAP